MTQAPVGSPVLGRAQPSGPPGVPPGPSGRPGVPAGQTLRQRRSRLNALARGLFQGSPGRLRVSGIAAVLVCLVFALLGASAFQARGNALADAGADADQLIRLQSIATDLVRADSLLTNGYLATGASGQQQQFEQALGEASRLIVDAAQANPADAAGLAEVSAGLAEYQYYAARAQAARIKSDPVGTGYLRQAGAALRGPDEKNPSLTGSKGMLPVLTDLIKANSARVDGAYSASHWAAWRLLAAAVIVLGGLVWVSVRLARQTRRYVNLPIAVAGAAVAVVLIAGTVAMTGAQGKANTVYDGPYTALRALANARIAAYTLTSDDNISLIYAGLGGNAGSYQTDADKQLKAVEAQLAAAARATGEGADFGQQGWLTARDAVIAKSADVKAAKAEWTAAIDLATSAASDSVNTQFKTFDTAVADRITAEDGKISSGLDGHVALVLIGWLALVVGVLAAVAAWAGVTQRLEEYR
jgi:hypothetical protein